MRIKELKQIAEEFTLADWKRQKKLTLKEIKEYEQDIKRLKQWLKDLEYIKKYIKK
jgi:hypothetical protein